MPEFCLSQIAIFKQFSGAKFTNIRFLIFFIALLVPAPSLLSAGGRLCLQLPFYIYLNDDKINNIKSFHFIGSLIATTPPEASAQDPCHNPSLRQTHPWTTPALLTLPLRPSPGSGWGPWWLVVALLWATASPSG